MSTRRGDWGRSYGQQRRGYSRGAVAAALIVGLLIGAGVTYALAGASLSRTTKTLTAVTSTSTITVTINSTQQVMSAYATHLTNIESENLTTIVGGYENNATFGITGEASGYAGTYDGAFNIRILYGTILSQSLFANVNIMNVSYAVNVLGNGKATVNSTFTMQGNGTYFFDTLAGNLVSGVYVGNVNAYVSYDRVDNAWLISNETWDFLSFNFNT